MHVTGETTVGEIVAGDFRAAAVFNQFGIDFCCGGKRTVATACSDRQVVFCLVVEALERACAAPGMAQIRELTGGFVAPEDGCTTFRVCLRELEAFEADLHAHVHLENNLLFPQALALAARQNQGAC